MKVNVFAYIFKDKRIFTYDKFLQIKNIISIYEVIKLLEEEAGQKIIYEDLTYMVNGRSFNYNEIRDIKVNDGDKITVLSPVSGG